MKQIASLFFFLVMIYPIFGQSHLSIKLTDPVYTLLNIAEAKGMIQALPSARPYTQEQIISFLKKMGKDQNLLSRQEKLVLSSFLEKYTNPEKKQAKDIEQSNILKNFKVGIQFQSDYRLNFNNPSAWHMFNEVKAYFKGDIGNFLSYYGSAGGGLNKIAPDIFYRKYTQENYPSPYYYIEDSSVQLYTGRFGYKPPGTFAPYQFSALWDGHHTDILNSDLTDGVSPSPSISLTTQDEIASEFFSHRLILRTGRIRREWGTGNGSLILSGTAQPFEGFELHLFPVDWFNYSFVVGSLGDWFIDTYIGAGNTPSVPIYSDQKMISLMDLEVFPLKWLSINFSSSAIWGKRFELAYLSPLLLPFVTQEFNGDFDNVNVGGGIKIKLPFVGNFYFNLFLDETSGSSLKTIFTFPRNMYAYQGGLKFTIPAIPFSLFTVQYSKINPFVYCHYSEANYNFSDGIPINMAYTNNGENLGYFLPPNSDEILVSFEALPIQRFKTVLKYQLIRHGTNNPFDEDGNGIPDSYIYGDINIPFDYENNESYPLKNFLHDGVYDWNNIITLKAEYSLKNFPLTIGASYIFSHTLWKTNGLLITTPDPVTQNIVSTYFKFYH